MSAWDPQEPPPDFAERVLARAREEEEEAREANAAAGDNVQDTHVEGQDRVHDTRISGAPTAALARGRGLAHARKRRNAAATVAAALAFATAAAAAIVTTSLPSPVTGEAIAKDRMEVPIGARAAAVLETGAHVKWTGDVVTQSAGDVFYRVEPGAAFRVRTPAGDVTVSGTCFRVRVSGASSSESSMNARDVKSGAIGVAIGAIALVAVYEGKVAVSRASEPGEAVMLRAGQRARASADGVRVEGESGEPGGAASASAEDPFVAANRNLADSVREYKNRLEAIEAQKRALEGELQKAQSQLATAEHDGEAPLAYEAEFDLSEDDWKELAKKGTVRARLPCSQPDQWTLGASSLEKLGLTPDDAPTIRDALARSTKRTWAVLRPLCTQALAGNEEMADKLGATTCEQLAFDVAHNRGEDVEEALRSVSEMRAGLRPMAANPTPIEKLLIVMSGETKALEADLTQSLGPDAAHRVVFSGTGCWNNIGRGAGPRPEAP